MDNSRDLLVNIGANLKAVRLAKGLQQKEAASMTGISLSQYGRIENGAAKASVITLAKIAKALDVGMDMLVFGEQVEEDKKPIVLKDKELIEKMKELDELSDEEKEVAHELLDLILTKKKLNELTRNFQKLSK